MKRLLINLTLLAAAALAAGSFVAGAAAVWLLLGRRGRRRQAQMARVERELASQRARAVAAERQLAQQAAAPVAPGRGVMASGNFVSVEALRAEADAAAGSLDAVADVQALDELLIETELPLAEVEVLQASLETSENDEEPAEIDMAALSRLSGAVELPGNGAGPGEDDLTVVDGIGPVFAARLRQHGILTFAGLAASDEAALDSIIQAPTWRRPDFAAWVAEAAQLAVQPITTPVGENLP